eukprot:1144527-Pelagomonas_calceolata.AAC.1
MANVANDKLIDGARSSHGKDNFIFTHWSSCSASHHASCKPVLIAQQHGMAVRVNMQRVCMLFAKPCIKHVCQPAQLLSSTWHGPMCGHACEWPVRACKGIVRQYIFNASRSEHAVCGMGRHASRGVALWNYVESEDKTEKACMAPGTRKTYEGLHLPASRMLISAPIRAPASMSSFMLPRWPASMRTQHLAYGAHMFAYNELPATATTFSSSTPWSHCTLLIPAQEAEAKQDSYYATISQGQRRDLMQIGLSIMDRAHLPPKSVVHFGPMLQ